MLKINLIIGTGSAAGPGNLQENILMELKVDHFMIMNDFRNLLAADSGKLGEDHSGWFV